MKVHGINLERAASLVEKLKHSECNEHSEPAEVHLIAGQDGSVQYSPNIMCCDEFRSEVQNAIDAHNMRLRM